MNRKKLACILTATMITSQLNSMVFATTKDKEIDNSANILVDDNQLEENNYNEQITKVVDEELNANVVGKIEVDINFAMPIKNTTSDITNISVTLLKDNNQVVGSIKLGNDNLEGNINNIDYKLQALDGKRVTITNDAEELNFYHLTFNNLELGTYSLKLEGEGYVETLIEDIIIQDSSKRIKVGTSDNKIVLSDNGTPDDESDDIVEYYPGVFLTGDVNGDSTITKEDYDIVKASIKSKSNNLKYDVNKDSKVDITDLTYIHKNIDKDKKIAEIVETDLIINPSNVTISLDESKVAIGEGQSIKSILVGDGSKISLSTKSIDGTEIPDISEQNPISIPIILSETSTYKSTTNVSLMETVVIKAPSETAPTKGTIVINGEVFNYSEENINRTVAKTASGESIDEIVIELGKQVAVSEITINVTGSRGNKNLTEIAQVEFLNNVYKEIPKPDMNIPVINNFTSTTSVGSESMTIGWDHEINVSGYEVKVQQLNNSGAVTSTKVYRTSENTLKITQVDPYGIYRFSIQSLNGSDWVSGYKDEQGDYDVNASGITNLATNSNDKDGIADNVDSNYIPKAWNSISGILDLNSKEQVENKNYFGADSIIELQVIPESKPEGPEGIVSTGEFGQLKVSWKAHKKAKDYDLYFRKVGDGAWTKANDPDGSYIDSDETDNIPTGVANLNADEKTDSHELIRGTSYNINGLESGVTYEIKMTATNHHGTGGLSNTYLGVVKNLVPPETTNYKLINIAKDNYEDGESPVEGIIDIKYGNWNSTAHPNGISEEEKFMITDNNYETSWTSSTWNIGYGAGPRVTFDKEYTMDTVRIVTRLDSGYGGGAYDYVPVRYFDSNSNSYVNINASYSSRSSNGKTYYEVKLPAPITTSEISVAMRIHPAYVPLSSISEIKFYNYDSLEDDVKALFADDLRIVLNDEVTQEIVDELIKRAKTIDPVSLEYHPNQESILEDLEMAQLLLNDVNLNKDVINLDASIVNNSPNLGQANNWQSLGVAVKPGDEISVYVGTEEGRSHSKFEVLFTQNYAESGTWSAGTVTIGVGKTDIQVPEGKFSMDVEKGGNVYIRPVSGWHENQNIQVRVSGGTKIPHLNVNNLITDRSRETEIKSILREYIRDLKLYVGDLPSLYPAVEDKVNNQYKYDEKTSILNSTEIESERVTLTLTATEVLTGITAGLNGDENAEVNRLYDSLLAWEQLMEISYSLKGVIENPIDFNENGKIDNDKNDTESLIDGLTEQEYFNKHRAPRNRINIKYQRMFTGAFMYASSHHVGIDAGSGIGLVQGVPFNFDSNGNITNPNEGSLYGWGINHEVGHVQDAANLTQAEVTNNILALITQTFNGTSESRLEGGTYLKMYDKVTSGSVGATSDIFAKLGMYWQLHLAYEQYETYEMLENNKDTNPNNDSFYARIYKLNRTKTAASKETGYDQVEQTFIMRASDAAGKDLREFFEKWGIIASPNTNTYLDEMNYPKETRAIYYLNDEARRRRLDSSTSETMAQDTEVNASFGIDKNGNAIINKTYLNQKEVPLNLSVTKDEDKILGYEIIRRESTATGVKEVPVGFVERDRNSSNGVTTYVDTIDAINNRTLGYKVIAYDYDLNKTEEVIIGELKVTHDGSIGKTSWILTSNTTNDEDIRDEHDGHGTVQDGVITRIKDNDPDTVFQGMKSGNQDPYVIIDLNSNKSLVGLTYTAPQTTTKKFSIMNLFKSSEEKVYKQISDYEVYTSMDGESWTLASSGKFDTTKSKETIYFSEDGKTEANQLWAYSTRYIKLVAKKNSEISIAELDLLTAAGDNIEIGVDKDDQVYENGIGRLKSDYEYAEGKVIPAGSIVVTGEYRGNPTFNIPLVLNENDENYALKSKAILLATLPENSELGDIAEGNWIYWIEPQDQGKVDIGNGPEENLEGVSVKAELYRYNKLNELGAPIGQRLVSDTFLISVPSDLASLPEIEFNNSVAKTYSSENKTVIEINNDLMNKAFDNR